MMMMMRVMMITMMERSRKMMMVMVRRIVRRIKGMRLALLPLILRLLMLLLETKYRTEIKIGTAMERKSKT